MFQHSLRCGSSRSVTFLGFAFILFLNACVLSQGPAKAEIVTFTTQQDHQNMMKQLGITELRPGPSGNPNNPNAANTDEAKANPYPDLPALMTMKDGTEVTTPEQWWSQRRPEIVEDFEREVIGRIPDGVPAVQWEVLKTIEKKLGKTEDGSTTLRAPRLK